MLRLRRFHVVAGLLLGCCAAPLAAAQQQTKWIVEPQWVAAHEAFLASDALQGRGSATRDEAIAAAYVASQFQSYGLAHAPGMASYLQGATVIREKLARPARLTVDGVTITPTLLMSSGAPVAGTLAVATSADPAALPAGDIVLVSAGDADPIAFYRAASARHVKLLLLAQTAATDKMVAMFGGGPRLPTYLDGQPPQTRGTVAIVPADQVAALARQAGKTVTLDVATTQQRDTTTNAIGYLKGSDPEAGTLLFTAHLDHLGVLPDGTIMHGANDDASGTTAVLELAHALAAGQRPKRSILFVCYGSEEIGEFGSTWFGEHPPIPLDQIVANVEFEMIGAQDPKLPEGTMMMTGFDRSNLGAALKAHGALVTGDPYPDQHFFERSDNYALALKGIVAHTVSGWAVTPTYHQPSDTIANLNLPFMTRAIQSLIAPAEWLANSDFKPAWNPGGKPAE